MESSAKELLSNMTTLYENIYNLLDGFQKATTTLAGKIEVSLKQPDGTSKIITINSFQKIQEELNRIDSNYKSMLSESNLSYTLAGDGSISQQTKTSFINAEFLSDFVFDGSQCIVDKTSNIDDLVFPNVKLPITLDSKIRSDIRCKIIDVTTGYDLIKEFPTLLDIDYLYSNGSIAYTEIDRTLSLQKEQIKYFGKFNIESIMVLETSNVFQVTLNDIKYTGLNTIGNSIDLKIGDLLVSKTGSSKYQITSLDKFSKILKITRVAGSEVLQVGIEALYFNETLPTDKNIVCVPIKPSKKYVVFLSTENVKNISFPSNGIKIDTASYQIQYQNITYTLDEFFSKYVTNFSEYLSALMTDTTIPINLGIIPAKPELLASNFKVLQVNKHLTDAKSLAELTDLNKQKQATQNQIDFKQTIISQTQQEIDTLKFSSLAEKNYRLDNIVTLRNDINVLNQNLLTITRNIDNNATKYGLKENKNKYKVIAFWPMQEAIYSPLTKAQNIIKYDVQYRYLSKDVDTVENTSYKMISNGKEVSVVFSSWIDLPTKTLAKVKNLNGDLIWEIPLLDSVDDININQLAISIKEGESIEVKVRAVSEAGFPIAPLKSEWSEVLRVDFPTDLKENNTNAVISQNSIDLNKAEFNAILNNAGLLLHIAGTIKESEKTFLHSAKDITSGQYTVEQKNIPLDTVISTILKEIELMKKTDTSNNITVSLVDFNSESYVVANNTTMEISAGNYADNLSLLDSTKFGTIIRKSAYIKIRNNNLVPIELKTLVPGVTFNAVNAPQYYNVPFKTDSNFIQKNKQIIYFRNIDLTGQSEDVFKLVKPKTMVSNTKPLDIDMVSSVDVDKNIAYLDTDNTVKICKLNSQYNTKFVAFTTEIPGYNYDNKDTIKSEFDRIKLYNEQLKAVQYQSEVNEADVIGLGFNANDFYAVGEYTCGAFLYPQIANQASISVVGNTTISTLIVPKESEILIPIIFEYRMTDRLGNINGVQGFVINNGLEYSKKIGIDIFLNNEPFKFDINVKAKLKSKVALIDSLNVSSITGLYSAEIPETLV